MAEGLPHSDFWHVTPRYYNLVMEGRKLSRISDDNLEIANAWMTEALRRTKRLPPLKSLLVHPDQAKDHPQSPDEMVYVLQELKAGGADINLKFIPHGEETTEEN